MSDPVYYDFRIDAWTPDTLPMSHLAVYLDLLSTLLGCQEQVHFVRVRKGSAVPELKVEHEAAPKVAARLKLVGSPDEPMDAVRARKDINDMLRKDNASAKLRVKHGEVIVEFPGCKTPLSEEVVIYEHGELDGVVIRIGGKSDAVVPVWIQGEGIPIYKCTATREIARELAPHYLTDPIRVAGKGQWRRTSERKWEIESFVIKTWQPLDAASLIDVINNLRNVAGSGWNDMANPQEELRKLRGD